MLFYDILAYLGGSLLAICLIPQLIVMWKNRSAQDVSWLWTVLYFLGLSLTFMYLLLIEAVAGWISILPELLFVVVLMISKKILDDDMEPVVDNGITGSAVDNKPKRKYGFILPDFKNANSKRPKIINNSRPSSVRFARGAGLQTIGKRERSSPVRTRIIGKHIYLDYYHLSFEGVALRDISKWLLRSIESCFDYYQRTKLSTAVTILQSGGRSPLGFNIILKLQKFYVTIFTCKNNEDVNIHIGMESSLATGPSVDSSKGGLYSLRFDIYQPEASSADELIPSGALSDLSTIDNDVYVTDNQTRQMVDLIHISITERFHATIFNIHNVVIQEKNEMNTSPSKKEKDSLLLYRKMMQPYDDEEEGGIWLSRSSSSDISISM